MANNTKVENFSLPNEIVKKLNEYSKNTMIPKSKLVTKLLREFFENKNDEKV